MKKRFGRLLSGPPQTVPPVHKNDALLELQLEFDENT
jgi:hypothetical protein